MCVYAEGSQEMEVMEAVCALGPAHKYIKLLIHRTFRLASKYFLVALHTHTCVCVYACMYVSTCLHFVPQHHPCITHVRTLSMASKFAPAFTNSITTPSLLWYEAACRGVQCLDCNTISTCSYIHL